MGLFEHYPYTNFQDLNLDGLIKSMKTLIQDMKSLEYLVGGYNDRILKLEKIVTALENGNFPPSLINALYRWLTINMPEIIKDTIKNVWFGLTDSGYFVAFIPESWSDIMFKTSGYDYITNLQPEYGHLILLER